MSLLPFSSVQDFSTVLSIGPLAKGMNGTLFFEAQPGHANLFQGPADMKQSYSIKPQGMNSTVKSGDKFEINLQVSAEDCADFVSAAARFDEFVLSSIYARKGEVLPKKADVINSVDGLRVLYHNGRLIKAGSDDKNGGKYPDNLRLKIVGEWGTYVASANTKVVSVKGMDKTVVDSVEWQGRTKPCAANETRFYLWVRKNEAGQDVYTDKVTSDKGVTRLVGPQDCRPGYAVTPVFSLSHVYVSEGIGANATARALYIKPVERAVDEGDSKTGFSATTSEIPMLGGAVLETSAAVPELAPPSRKRVRFEEGSS